jgi:hypothetical protein
LRRVARFGDAWHPILRSLQGVDESLSKIREQAAALSRPEPHFSPRIRLDLRDAPIGGERLPGTGSLKQIRADLRSLESLGADHVVLDWYTGDLEATRDHDHGLGMLAALADEVLDLENEALR